MNAFRYTLCEIVCEHDYCIYGHKWRLIVFPENVDIIQGYRDQKEGGLYIDTYLKSILLLLIMCVWVCLWVAESVGVCGGGLFPQSSQASGFLKLGL